MADIIQITFTNTNPQFSLKPSSPEELSISITEAIKGLSGADGSMGNAENIEGFTTDPTFYYILAST